jgi:predicted nuclease of predicted toxin-antitoxin system
MTRDADFTRLNRSLLKRVKVIYIQPNGEPAQLAELVLQHIGTCPELLSKQRILVLDQEGCHAV